MRFCSLKELGDGSETTKSIFAISWRQGNGSAVHLVGIFRILAFGVFRLRQGILGRLRQPSISLQHVLDENAKVFQGVAELQEARYPFAHLLFEL
jgi:hypothetical protein